eukprot:07616.XXX_392620_392721_1 [CDS] Oithona nana genome sequencing.
MLVLSSILSPLVSMMVQSSTTSSDTLMLDILLL